VGRRHAGLGDHRHVVGDDERRRGLKTPMAGDTHQLIFRNATIVDGSGGP
jgi:hypothetical protein